MSIWRQACQAAGVAGRSRSTCTTLAFRFVTDERRELQYRVQVQNRVYRREVAALDLEIARLERQLFEPSASCSSSTPSISGGLPLLLLSVLPPVIPRASWPGALPSRACAFSSEPRLARASSASTPPGGAQRGVLARLRGILRRPSGDTGTTGGIALALRAHVGCMAGLVPAAGSAAPRINVEPPGGERRTSCGGGRRPQRPRGSPRFPHRIVPATASGALIATSLTELRRPGARGSRLSLAEPGAGGRSTPAGRSRSMEDAWVAMPPGARRGSGLLAVSKLPAARVEPPAAARPPTADPWAVARSGTPLDQLVQRQT